MGTQSDCWCLLSMHMYRIIAVHVGVGCASVRLLGNLFFHIYSLRDRTIAMPVDGDLVTFRISKQMHDKNGERVKRPVAVVTD